MTIISGPLRWRERSGPERFEAYTRWSISSVFALEPFVALLLLTGSADYDGVWPLVYVLSVTVHAVLAARVFGPAMSAYSGRGPMPWRRIWLLLGATAAVWAIALLGYPQISGASGLAILVPAAGALGALAPAFRTFWQLLLAGVGVVALACALLLLGGAQTPQVVAVAMGGVLAVVGSSASFRLSAWTMRVVWELDDARAVAGRLAVAEERLRFSRDLHDTFGRALSTVAVKSELAAALAERGDPRGSAEMLEVRQIAHDALREVRGLVQGYRSADLDTEIAGARELLRSAGIECRVAGEGLALPEPVAEAAAWVVRETVTNVVRHSQASRCDIDVRVVEDECRVRVTNDGVSAAVDPASGGNGLRGLRERLGARGGGLAVAVGEGTFEVDARVPMTSTGETIA